MDIQILKLVRAHPNTPAEFVERVMRRRNRSVLVRLTDEELNKIDTVVKYLSCSREEYIRQVALGKEIYEKPPAEYKEIVRELRVIGSNVHQLLLKAIQTKFVDELMIQDVYDAVIDMDEKFERAFAVKRKKKRVSEWR